MAEEKKIGFLECVIINQTGMTLYIEMWDGLLIDDWLSTFCARALLHPPSQPSKNIHKLDHNHHHLVPFPERKHVFFTPQTGVIINIATRVQNNGRMILLLRSVNQGN